MVSYLIVAVIILAVFISIAAAGYVTGYCVTRAKIRRQAYQKYKTPPASNALVRTSLPAITQPRALTSNEYIVWDNKYALFPVPLNQHQAIGFPSARNNVANLPNSVMPLTPSQELVQDGMEHGTPYTVLSVWGLTSNISDLVTHAGLSDSDDAATVADYRKFQTRVEYGEWFLYSDPEPTTKIQNKEFVIDGALNLRRQQDDGNSTKYFYDSVLPYEQRKATPWVSGIIQPNVARAILGHCLSTGCRLGLQVISPRKGDNIQYRTGDTPHPSGGIFRARMTASGADYRMHSAAFPYTSMIFRGYPEKCLVPIAAKSKLALAPLQFILLDGAPVLGDPATLAKAKSHGCFSVFPETSKDIPELKTMTLKLPDFKEQGSVKGLPYVLHGLLVITGLHGHNGGTTTISTTVNGTTYYLKLRKADGSPGRMGIGSFYFAEASSRFDTSIQFTGNTLVLPIETALMTGMSSIQITCTRQLCPWGSFVRFEAAYRPRMEVTLPKLHPLNKVPLTALQDGSLANFPCFLVSTFYDVAYESAQQQKDAKQSRGYLFPPLPSKTPYVFNVRLAVQGNLDKLCTHNLAKYPSNPKNSWGVTFPGYSREGFAAEWETHLNWYTDGILFRMHYSNGDSQLYCLIQDGGYSSEGYRVKAIGGNNIQNMVKGDHHGFGCLSATKLSCAFGTHNDNFRVFTGATGDPCSRTAPAYRMFVYDFQLEVNSHDSNVPVFLEFVGLRPKPFSNSGRKNVLPAYTDPFSKSHLQFYETPEGLVPYQIGLTGRLYPKNQVQNTMQDIVFVPGVPKGT